MSDEIAIPRAFVLGAGLGTRLRPLTEHLPKPLVPVWNAPLITHAFDHLIHDAGVSGFLVNTHHAAGRYREFFPEGEYRGCPLEFRFEEVLLDTAGGIDNVRDRLGEEEDFLVYNGDILTDLPLRPAIEMHRATGDLVTLILRPKPGNVAWDRASGRVMDLRNLRRTNASEQLQFTGIYLVSRGFFDYLEPGRIESVVHPFVRVIEDGGRVGGCVVGEGVWTDLGDPATYREASALLARPGFPSYGLGPGKMRIHPGASIHPSASVDAVSSIGDGVVIGEDAVVIESVIWAGARIAPGERIERRVVVA